MQLTKSLIGHGAAPLLALYLGLNACAACGAEDGAGPSGFTLWQLPNQTHTQMMSYVMQTAEGSLIVIDGGMPGDAAYLRAFIAERGNHVHTWFISHMHDDHVGALIEILKQPGDLKIDSFCGSLPDDAWMEAHTGESEVALWNRFKEGMAAAKREVSELEPGQTMTIDEVTIEVLGVKNPEITQNPINNSSVVMRVTDAGKSVLFTGDLGAEGGRKLLDGPYADRLPSDYVQMSHHGQNGADKAFYERVGASCCLWPAPKWLWDNDKGGGRGSGPWKTLEVRKWMEELGTSRHIVMCEGLAEIQ
ncbi:MAG: MBL fold metallo-hydrolase [bacterium]|nr:MBL fold metallo-hydrolase [bacterium]